VPVRVDMWSRMYEMADEGLPSAAIDRRPAARVGWDECATAHTRRLHVISPMCVLTTWKPYATHCVEGGRLAPGPCSHTK
jgi:hypothetical protein